jgi:cyclic pyranopterin phosphate synthase
MLSFKKFRFTGGEPLTRKGVIGFFCLLNDLKKQYKFKTAITTNGTLLFEMLPELKKYGVDNINISLDSLKQDSFKMITGKNIFNNVINAVNKAKQIGFDGKNNCGDEKCNDSEILDFTVLQSKRYCRFIKHMLFSNNG